ncbi:MAG: hypothetical protein MJ162_06505 [Treponema sp.]|nr:hypothetical protein [Treponema sp.]
MRLKQFFRFIFILNFSLLALTGITSCKEQPSERIVIWTSCAEFAQYCELFNTTHPGNKAILVYKENPALSMPPAKDELPPDIIVGSWLCSDKTHKNFKSLDYLFDFNKLSSEVFYTQLLSAGKHRNSQYLLPVSFNIPAIIFSKENSNLITENYTLTPENIRTIAASYNQKKRNGSFTRIGFVPSADANFLYLMAKLNNVDFREEKNQIVYNPQQLDKTIEDLKNWITTENKSAQEERDFDFKYLFMPDYRQITSGRTLFAYTTSDKLLMNMKDQNLSIDYRWITSENQLPIEDTFTTMGIYKDARNQPGASEFIAWFFDSETQKQILERKSQLDLNTEMFGIAGGFSSLREVTDHILPVYYTQLLTNLPPAELLKTSQKLPPRWETYKANVVEEYLSIAVAAQPDDTVPSLPELEAEWQKKVFDN